jgi:hypothetical protein
MLDRAGKEIKHYMSYGDKELAQAIRNGTYSHSKFGIPSWLRPFKKVVGKLM